MSDRSLFLYWISNRVSGFFKGGVGALVFALVFFAFASSAFGQATRTWQGSAGGDWTVPANWSGGVAPVPGDNVIIDSDQSAPITNHPAISLLSLNVSGNVNLISDAGVGANRIITVTGSFSVAAGKTLTLGTADIGGTGFTLGDTATGTIAGTLFLNSVAGTPPITINGNLAISTDGLISGQATSRFTLSAGATLQIANTGGITTTGGTTGAILVGGTRTYSTGANYIYNGTAAQVTGNGLTELVPSNLTISNNAGVSLSAFKTISGALTVNGGSTFMIPNGQYLGSNNIIMETGAAAPTSITGDGTGYLNLTVNLTVTDNGGGTTGATISSLVDLPGTGPRTITVADGAANADLTISGVIRNAGRIVKEGAGTLVLSAINTYSGSTTVNAGILRAGVNDALSSGELVVNGGSYDIATFTDVVGVVRLTSGSIVGTTGLLTGTNYFVDDGTVSASFAGTGTLTKNTSGTVTLSGTNTYTGATDIYAGILRIGSTGTLPNNSTVILRKGTLSTGETTGFSDAAGNLRLIDDATIALGTGSHELRFSNSGGWTAGKTLTITGWTGTAGVTGTSGKIFVSTSTAGLSADKLAQITFSGYAPGATILSTGEVVPLPPYRAQIISTSLGASTWCPGDIRDISVTVRNTGALAWTDGAGGTPTIKIGVKWNTNGTSWNDYYVTVPANNLAPNDQATFTLSLTAADNVGGTYGSPLAAGSNNITFDVINEGVGSFGSNTNGLGPGNTASTSSAITVLPAPIVNAGGSLPDICQGGTSLAMGGSVGGGATGGTWSGGAGSWTTPTNPATATYTASASESGLITLTLTTSGGSCGTTTATKTITVNQNPTVNAGGVLPAICQGDTSAPLGGSFGGAATIAVWSSNGSGTFNNNTGATPGTATYTTGATDSGTITLTLTASGGSCGTVIATKDITINQDPTANAGGELAAICQGSTSEPLGGSFGGGATGAVWSSNGSGTFNNNTGATPGTATYRAAASESGTITLTLTTTGGSCGSITVTKEITINENPTADAGGSLGAICQGEPSAVLGGSFGGAATSAIWTSDGGGTFTDNTGSTPGTATYIAGATDSGTITLTLTTNGGLCGAAIATKTITVNQNPTANAGPALADICQDAVSTAMGGSVGGGATGGTWSGGAGTWTNANNPSTATYKAHPAESGSITLTLTTSGGLCGTTTATKTITVNQNPTALAGPTPPAICQGQTSAPMGGSVGGGATGGIWTGGAGTWTNATDPALATYTAGASESGSIILTLTTTGGSCGTIVRTKTITVNPTPTFTSDITSTRCSNVPTTYTATTTTPFTSFSWTRSEVGGISPATGSGSGQSATETLINTTTDPIDVVYVYTLTSNGCTFTQEVTVTVNSETVILQNPDPTGDEVCFGDGFSDISVSATGTDLTYQWYSNTVADTTSGTPITGEVSASLNPSSTPVGIQYYYVKVRGSCGTLVSELSGKYEVKPTLTVFLDNLEVADTQTICYGEEFEELSVLADGIEPLTYQWYSSTSPAQNTNGTAIPGATLATFTPQPPVAPITTAITRYYYVMASSGCGTIRSVKTGAFTVNPTPVVDDMTSAVCSDGSFTVTPANNTNGVVPAGTIYSWGIPSLDAGITGGVAGSGASITGSLTNSTSAPLTAIYTVTPTTGTCTGPNFTVTVTVNPTPVIPDQTQTICSGSAFTISPVDGEPGTLVPAGTTYTWTRVDNISVTGDLNQGTPQANISQTLVNNSNVVQTVVYTVTPRSGVAGSCAGLPFEVTVTIDPKPVVPNQTLAVCSGSEFTVSPTHGNPTAATIVPAGTTYTWTVVDNPNVTGEGDQGSPQASISQTLTNTTNVNQTVVYTVIPTSGDAGSCVGSSFNVTVTVNPTPTIPDQIATVCSGSPFTVSPVNGTPTGTIVPSNTRYTWTVADNPNVTGEADQGTPQTNISQTLINTTNVAQTVVYTVTPTSGTAGTCVGPTFKVTVTLTPALKLISSLTPPAICSRTPFTYEPIANIPGVTIRWTRPKVTGISNPAVTFPQSVNSAIGLENLTANPIDVVYIYTLSANGCTNTEYVTVTVKPTSIITPSPITLPNICSGDTFSFTPVDGVNGLVLPNTTYTWTIAGSDFVEGDLPESIPQTSISQTLTNPGLDGSKLIKYFVTPWTDGCAGRNFEVRVNVYPAPTVIVSDQGVCNGEETDPIIFTGNTIPGKTYTWTNSDPSIGLPASGSGNIPAFTVMNTGGTDKVATITVTPRANGCAGTPQTFTITASAIPTVTLGADYCAVPGFVKLVASSNIPETTFEWNTVPAQFGETINVDVAGTYIVTATTPAGCQETASISVAQELVVNGSFTAGNTGFYSGNNYVSDDPLRNDELEPEGRYAVGSNAHDYHRYFWGIDHTNNTVGPRNMMIINTLHPDTTVWQQTVNVEANTDYYFSAWAMTINPAPSPPYNRAELAFEVNGVQVGSTANLGPGPSGPEQAANNIYWERFYGIWSAGSYSGPITIKIINLEGSLGGNDFALDDISFGTLSTFLILTSPEGTDDQTVCENSPITDISYSAGSGVDGPDVDGLPDGVTASWNGVTLRISGTPTESGTFTYTVSTTGSCAPISKTGTITVQSSPEAGEISGDQTICSGGDPVAFTSTAVGSSPGADISYRWERAESPFTSWSVIAGAENAIYDVPAGLTATTQYRRIALASLNGLICESLPETSPTVTVTVQSVPTAGAIAGEQATCSDGDPVAFTSTAVGTGDGNISYQWESAVSPFGPTDWTTISGATSATYAPSGLTVTTQYRRITVSELAGRLCYSVPTDPITVTVQSVPTPGEISGEQTICSGGDPVMISSEAAGTGTGSISYRWESAVSGTNVWTTITGATEETYDVPAGLTVTTEYRRFAISTVAGQLCESPAPTAPITIIVQGVPTAGAIEGTQEICGGGDPATFTNTTDGTGDGSITYRWESAVSPFTDWTPISGPDDEFYDVPAGLTVTTQFRRITISTLDGQACESAPTSVVEITISPDNTVTTATPQELCINGPLSPITHTTTGANGIVPESASVNHNLPNGVTAVWNAGVITISGTPTESGVFDYSIPLTGGCGSVNAVGTITVTDPSYPITDIDVLNPQPGDPTPATSTFTVYSAELTPGSYTVVYSTDGVNQGPDRTITVNVTTPGRFTFTTLPYTLGGTTLLKILSIQKSTDLCAYVPPYQHTAPYGLGCSEEFLSVDGNDIFYVPSNTYQITVQVFGTGTVSRTASVLPGDSIFVVFDGANTFATQVPADEPMATRFAQAIASTSGSNGRIVFGYDCDPLPPCAATIDNGNQYTDSDGFTVLRFDAGSCTWTAPDGLTEFEVLIVGGGGGGGFGTAAGGGGGGEVMYRQFMDIRTGAEIGLRGATFNISVGAQGAGAVTETQGGSGGSSTFDGPAFTYLNGGTFTPMSVTGGGGGGSTSTNPSIRQGGSGASGGGGAAFGTAQSAGGAGISDVGSAGGTGYAQAFGISGGGGGGVSGVGGSGSDNGGNVMLAGNGGIGFAWPISGESVIYGAGGGGTSSGAITNQAGAGGSPYDQGGINYSAGGGGTNNGTGKPATTYGSGGGAGSAGGSAGFPGVVYIRYPNYRILPVEYLFFNAKYNQSLRSGDLTWATANEWENERFDIERSVNTVKDWETIGQVQGAGYSDQRVDYAYRDMNLPLSGGNIFYRLKQWSFSGDSSYSDTKAIRVEAMQGTSYWRVYPNPTTGNPINLELVDRGIYHDELVMVRIIAATGQFDVIESKAGSSLNEMVSQNLRTKAAGLYTIEINWGIYREYHKVILRR